MEKANEIPESLKEFPPPETLVSLDNQLLTMVEDIKIILESRAKEFHLNSLEKKLKAPVVPEQFVFETFKTDRKRYVNDFMHIDNSDRKKTFSEAATKEMESSWQVDKLFEGDKLMGMLIDFYREAGHRVLNENQILMSRWSRFARTFGEIQKYDYLFKKRQESLQELYKDCVVRYERLYEIYMRKEIDAQMTEELEEQKRVRDERDGLAVLKQKETTKQTKRKEKSECSNVMNALGGDDLDLKQFHLTDFTIFVRWYIQTLNENADLDLFITKTKNLVQSDRAEFLSDYVLLSQLSPGDTLGDELEYYEGTNGFITQCAINPPKIEDFFVEYDTLVHDWKIETLIGQEDGRPFAYEVDHRFMDKVYDQAAELTLVPYEGLVTNEDPNSEGIKTNGIGGYNGNLGLDSSIVTLATIAGVNITLNKGKMPRMKNADWLECNILKPDFDAISLRNRQLIDLLVETDMELKLEYDVLMLSDHEQIQSQLKDSAKRMWGRAASVPNCRPIMTKVSIIPQGKEQKSDSENLEIRYPKLFDMGFKIPTGNFEDRTDHILAEKKLAYGVILKTNEDTRKLEMEILNADPNKVFDKSNYIVPTVASVFAEHEVLGFQQLRYIKVREFRIKLLRQLNFFRSIEKRLAMDISAIKHPDPSSTINIFNGALADMLEKGEFFEIHHKSSKENVSEDVRTVMNDKIYISDRKGVNIIYDVAVKDLETFDQEMIRVLTAYLNSPKNTDGKIDLQYLDELRFRTSNRRNDLPNITFRNPNGDRMQMMMEYYDMYIDYNYAKIQLINCYLEAFEHATTPAKATELAQLMTNFIHAKPVFDLEDTNFSKSIVQAKHAVLMHARLVEDTIKHITTRHREWAKRFQPQTIPKDLEPTDYSKQDPKTIFYSHLKFGLPEVVFTEDVPTVTMHQPGISFGVTEVIPELENITRLWPLVQQACDDSYYYISSVCPKENYNRHVAETVILKIMVKNWELFADSQFRLPLNKRGTILESDEYFSNPYIPDAILKELYVPFDQTDENNHKSLEVLLEPVNFFNDPSFESDGIEILYRLLRVIVMTNKITMDWLETEYWRKKFDNQLKEIGAKKSGYNGRFPSLKFDYQIGGTIKDLNDDGGEDDQDLEQQDSHITDSNDNDRLIKYGPLAIVEIDETLVQFEGDSIEGILVMIKREGMNRLKHIHKAQLIEKYWNMSASELTNLILLECDIHEFNRKTILGSIMTEESTLKKNDLNPLLPTIMNQKRLLRKVMQVEFAKENKAIMSAEIGETESEQRMRKLKDSLLDFYHRNMVNVVSQEVERTEFAKFMTDFRTKLEKTNYASLIFAVSPISKYAEYLSNTDGQVDSKSALKQPAATQGLVFADSNGTTDRLAKLWYIPHVTEIIGGMTRNEKFGKQQQFDLSWTVFKNPGHFLKSIKVHSLIHDIFHLVAFTSNVLQGNSRYSAAVAAIRQADYIVNSMNSIKRDFLVQGENAEFSRVQKGLMLRWQFWTLKWKLFLGVCNECLQYKMLFDDVIHVQHLHEKSITHKLKKGLFRQDRFKKLFSKTKRRMVISTNLLPEFHLFLFLSKEAKQLCDFRVSEVEEDLEEIALSLQSEPKDELKQKVKIDYVSNQLKRFALQKEYVRLMNGGDPIPFKDEEARNNFFMKFKMRIIVPAIRAYHRQGSKGGLTSDQLLRDNVVLGSVSDEFKPVFLEPDFNRIGKTAFDRCIVVALQNELFRQYTQKRVHEAKEHIERLTDERIGRLFRASDNIHISSVTGSQEYVFKLSEQDYNVKSELFNDFLADMFHASVEFSNSLKQLPNKGRRGSAVNLPVNGKTVQLEEPLVSNTAVFDDKRVFACKKQDLGNILVKFATRLNDWKNDRRTDHEKFFGALNSHLIEMVKNCEKIISQQAQEKKESAKNFERDARLLAHDLALDAYSAMSSLEVELIETKRNKKVDEKRIRARILEEYDSLVDELVREIAILRNRFHEYQSSSYNDIMNIVSESKKEQLMTMKNDENLTVAMRNAVSTILKHDEEIEQYRQQNHELKMTVLKVRSMFTMREQGAKSFFQSKLRTLSEFTKETETRLWDSFRDSEARERALRKQLARLQKSKSWLDIQNEVLNRQLQEEAGKPRLNETQTKAKSGRAASKTSKRVEGDSKPKRHEGINVDNLIQELANKTALVEELLQEKRDKDKIAKPVTRPTTEQTYRASSAKRSKSPLFFAQAAEPSHYQREQRIANERLEELETENKALRRKLFLNGINLPPESKKSLSNVSHYEQQTRSRPRTAISQSSTLRMTPALVEDRDKLPAIKRLSSASKQVAFQDIKTLDE